MNNFDEFKDYLIYNELGEIEGIRRDAPQNAKIAYRVWDMAQRDEERLAELFSMKS